MTGHRVTMLGTGLIGLFYTRTLHRQRNHDRVQLVYARSEEQTTAFAHANEFPRGRQTSRRRSPTLRRMPS